MQFKIDTTIFDVIDVSASGISLMSSAKFSPVFLKDKILKDCKLGINKNTYDIAQAKVVSSSKASSDSMEEKIKVGLHFDHLTKNVEQRLSLDISMEARGEQIARSLKTKKK